MPISPASSPVLNEFHPTEEQVLAEIPGGSKGIAHSTLINALKRHAIGRQAVNPSTVYYHVGELVKKSLIDQARQKVDGFQRMEMHYRRRAVR